MPRRQATQEAPQLTEAQRTAVNLLAAGGRADEVAQQVDVNPDLITQWRREPVFLAALNTALRDARDSIGQRLRGLAGAALATVEQVMGDQAAPPQLRLQAALKVLELVGAGEQAKAKIGSVTPEDVEADQRREQFEKSMY